MCTDLVEHSELVWGECSDHRMKQASVMEQHEISLFPILGIDELNDQYTDTEGERE